MENRHSRTLLLLGEEAQTRLEKATVAVVGLGAVGGFALEALARSGIGRLRPVDFDRFEESNLNRQILATTESLGRPKTEIAAERLRLIAPGTQTEIRTLFFSKETAEEIDYLHYFFPDYTTENISKDHYIGRLFFYIKKFERLSEKISRHPI